MRGWRGRTQIVGVRGTNVVGHWMWKGFAVVAVAVAFVAVIGLVEAVADE